MGGRLCSLMTDGEGPQMRGLTFALGGQPAVLKIRRILRLDFMYKRSSGPLLGCRLGSLMTGGEGPQMCGLTFALGGQAAVLKKEEEESV
jgi:hypothetical protein